MDDQDQSKHQPPTLTQPDPNHHPLRKSNQPYHHAPKTRILSKLRRRKIIEACLDGKPVKDVAIGTGLSPKSASDQVSEILKEPRTQNSFISILNEEGLSDKFLAAKVRALLEAKQSIFAQKDGMFTDERIIEALETQRKTLELTAKLKGHLKDQGQGDINIGLMQMVVKVVRESQDDDE